RCRRQLIPCFLPAGMRRTAAVIEPEEQRSKGVLRFCDAVRGAELESRDDEPVVPFDDENDGNLRLTARNTFEHRERVHARMVVLDEHNVESTERLRRRKRRWTRLKRAVRRPGRFDYLDRRRTPGQALSSERGVADVEEPDGRRCCAGRRLRPSNRGPE